MSDMVPVDLENLEASDIWILERRIDQEGGALVAFLLVEFLLLSILCSSHSQGFLCSVGIMQEIRSGGGREICHKNVG